MTSERQCITANQTKLRQQVTRHRKHKNLKKRTCVSTNESPRNSCIRWQILELADERAPTMTVIGSDAAMSFTLCIIG